MALARGLKCAAQYPCPREVSAYRDGLRSWVPLHSQVVLPYWGSDKRIGPKECGRAVSLNTQPRATRGYKWKVVPTVGSINTLAYRRGISYPRRDVFHGGIEPNAWVISSRCAPGVAR
jgi:hypothetical protein